MLGELKKLINPRCAIYCRVSTEDQANKWTSLESQQEDCLRYIRNRDGGGTVNQSKHIYVDNGKTGTNDDRPEFQKMIQDAKNGEFDMIVVKRLDRLFQKISLASKYLEILDRCNVKIYSISESFDTATIMGKVMFELLSVFAGLEANLIRDRTINGKRKRSADWYFVGGGFAPYGYSLVDRKLIVNESEANVVRRIFGMYTKEKKGVSEISAILTAEGQPIHSVGKKKGKEKSEWMISTYWSGNFIYKILANTVYYGKYYYWRRSKNKTKEEIDEVTAIKIKHPEDKFKDCVSFDCPRILWSTQEEACEIFDLAAKIREENRKSGKFGDYLFSGKIKCEATGYTYIWTRNRHWTVCYKIHKAKSKPNHDKKIGIQVLEEELVEMIIEFLNELINVPSTKLEDFIRERVLKEDRTQNLLKEIGEIDKRINEIQIAIKKFTDSFIEVGLLADDFKKKAIELWDQREVLMKVKNEKESALKSLEQTRTNIEIIRKEFKDFKSRLPSLSYKTKRLLVKSVIETINIDIDRHYRFELCISEDIRKYFDWSDDSNDGSGGINPLKKPRKPTGSNHWGVDKSEDINTINMQWLWSQELWGSENGWVSNLLAGTTKMTTKYTS